ncbi:hypothetical protein ACROYT_G025847 [Oculina patagonica]
MKLRLATHTSLNTDAKSSRDFVLTIARSLDCDPCEATKKLHNAYVSRARKVGCRVRQRESCTTRIFRIMSS